MDFSNLNKEQIKAVKHIDGPLLILAGAGSGKTTVMTNRIAYMIENGISPANILAVTFTNKAAGEMRDRISRLTDNTFGMWLMTFHAMCLRMLRFYSNSLGYKDGFTIYDESDKKSVIRKIMKEEGIEEKKYKVNAIKSFISEAKEKEIYPEDYLEVMPSNSLYQTVALIYEKYQKILMNNNAMDFDDLILNGVKLLETDEMARDYYQNRFKYIMVDEYQDTNHLQYKLIKILSENHQNLCVVGDDDQCIYEWRGADINNILDFEKDFKKTKIIKLEQNYRSTQNILELANSVIKNNHGRKKKRLWSDKEKGEKIKYRRYDTDKEEVGIISEEIENLHASGYEYRDIAILYRKNAQSRVFEEKFIYNKIPYKLIGGTGFYERKEIKDILAYLRLIDNPNDDVAFQRVINEPKRGLGDKTLGRIIHYANLRNISLFEAISEEEILNGLNKKSGAEVEKFLEAISGLRNEIENLRLCDLYDNLLNQSGYLKALELENTIEADSRIENIMELRTVISEFENMDKDFLTKEMDFERENMGIESGGEELTELGAFLEKLSLLSDIDRDNDNDDKVTMMTLHSAKGLEFKVVFMPGLENGMFPSIQSLQEMDKLEEERRLCYVGITRAKERLFLSGAKVRMIYGSTDYTAESKFIDEMEKSLIDGDISEKSKEKFAGGLFGDDGYFGDFNFKGRKPTSIDGYNETPIGMPFDFKTEAKKITEKKRVQSDLKQGEMIRHPKFGIGKITGVTEKILIIEFENGETKKIGKGYVDLKRV